MKKVLRKCNKEDFEYLDLVLDSYAAFTNDSKRKDLIKEVFGSRPSKREELISLVDKQIRYYGSSDVAYAFRSIFNNDGGVSGLELVGDVADKLKIKLKSSSSVESKLERLSVAVVDKELASKSSSELIKSFKEMGISDQDLMQFKAHVKSSGVAVALPLIFKMLGPKIALKIVENILINVIAYVIGATAARQLVGEILKRNPLINVLGPAVWVVSGTWLAFDIQGPAYRKTIPVCLYLGIVSLRDGFEEKKQREVLRV